jgi:hypothetical protein
MRLSLHIALLLALLLSIVWVVFKPGFDSSIAVITSLAALISSFLIKKERNKRPTQSQKISDDSIGVQAGRDANVSNIKR